MKTPNHPLTLIIAGLFLILICSSTGISQNTMSKAVALNEHDKLEWFACAEPLDFEGCEISILNGDPTKANSDVLFKMQPGTTAREHWHSSAERMILLSGELHVQYRGEAKQVLKAGSFAYGPAEKPHTAECVGDEPCVLFIAFVKPVDTFVEE